MTKLIFLTLIAYIALNQQVARAQAPINTSPEDFKIIQVTPKGNPCKSEGTPVTISPDNNDASVLFDNFINKIGSTQFGLIKNKTIQSQVCKLEFLVSIPNGWRFGVLGPQWSGFASLVDGSWGYLVSKVQLGSHQKQMSNYILRGPFEDNFTYQPNFGLKSDGSARKFWSSCSHHKPEKLSFIVRAGLEFDHRRLPKSGPQYSELDVDSFDLSFKAEDNVTWQKCDEPA